MKIRLAHLVLFVLAIALAGVLVLPRPKQMTLWQTHRGGVYKIIDRHRRALEARPGDVELERNLASFLIEAASFDEAVSILNHHIENDLSKAEALRVMAHYQENITNPQSALDTQLELSKLIPLTEEFLESVVPKLLWQKRYQDLVTLLEDAKTQNVPLTQSNRMVLARSYEILEQYDPAIQVRERLLDDDPSDWSRWQSLIDLNQILGNEKKELNLRKSFWVRTKDVDVGLNYMRRLQEVGDTEGVKNFIGIINSKYPDNKRVALLVLTQAVESKADNLEEVFLHHLDRWPDDHLVKYDYGTWLADNERVAEAKRIFTEVMEDAGEAFLEDNVAVRAFMLAHLERYEEAIGYWETLIDDLPIESRIQLVILYRQMKEFGLELRMLRELILISPTQDRRVEYSFRLADFGHLDPAIREWEALLQDFGSDKDILAAMTYAQLELNRGVEARETAHQLYSQYPEDREAIRIKALFLHLEGDDLEAFAILHPLYKNGSLLGDEVTLYADVLIGLGHWRKGFEIYGQVKEESPEDVHWWSHVDLGERYQDRVTTRSEIEIGSNHQRIRRFETRYNTFLSEEFELEIGVDTTLYDRSQEPNATVVHERVPSQWLFGEWQWENRRWVSLKIQNSHNDHSNKVSQEIHVRGENNPWTWNLGYMHQAVAQGAVELIKYDGRENRFDSAWSWNSSSYPMSVFGGLSRWRTWINKKNVRDLARRELGRGLSWSGGARWTLQPLVLDTMPQFDLSYQYQFAQFSPTSGDVFLTVPLLDEQRNHSLTVDSFHRWDRAWEWSGALGYSVDTPRRARSWLVSNRFVYRTPDHWRVSAGFDYSTEAATAEGGNTRRFEFEVGLRF